MSKVTLEGIKERHKGYTEAFGYYSCRKDDFDWLMAKVAEQEKLIEELEVDLDCWEYGSI